MWNVSPPSFVFASAVFFGYMPFWSTGAADTSERSDGGHGERAERDETRREIRAKRVHRWGVRPLGVDHCDGDRPRRGEFFFFYATYDEDK